MKVVTEIYLTNKLASSQAWLKLIQMISKYNGIFRKWDFIVKCDQSKIRYYVKTSHPLPTTINQLEEFVLKQVESNEIKLPSAKRSIPKIRKSEDNFVDVYNYFESKKGRLLKYSKISIFPISKERFLDKTKLYFETSDSYLCSTYLCNVPSTFLAIDFHINKRFFYSKVPKYLKLEKQISLLTNTKNHSLFQIDTFPYGQGNSYLNHDTYDFAKHSLILGSSGSGKSKLISLLVDNIYHNEEQKKNYKIVMIDPHAAMEKDIGGLESTKTIDFKTDEDSIDLFMPTNEDHVSSTELFLSLFKTLIMDQYNSKLERVLRYSVYLLLASQKFDFMHLRKLLLDVEFRNQLVREYRSNVPTSVIEFFLNDFQEMKINYYGEAIAPIISFIDEMQLLPVFDQKEKNVHNLKGSISNHFLTILSLDRIQLGDKITKTISGLVMQQLLGLVQSYTFEEHIIFILDEISIIENPIVCRFLSEARKYNVSVFIAGQYLSQVSQEVKDAIFANILNYYIFRVSQADASMLVKHFDINIPLENTEENKIKMLTDLPNRSCLIRVSKGMTLYSAMKGITLDFNPSPRVVVFKQNSLEVNVFKTSTKKKLQWNSSTSLKDILKETATGRKEFKL